MSQNAPTRDLGSTISIVIFTACVIGAMLVISFYQAIEKVKQAPIDDVKNDVRSIKQDVEKMRENSDAMLRIAQDADRERKNNKDN